MFDKLEDLLIRLKKSWESFRNRMLSTIRHGFAV